MNHCIVCTGNWKLSSILKDTKGSKSQYDKVEMGPYSEVLEFRSNFKTEAQYEECGRGVTSSDATVEENPAYQTVDVVAKPMAMEATH